jgi:hypothetical protein
MDAAAAIVLLSHMIYFLVIFIIYSTWISFGIVSCICPAAESPRDGSASLASVARGVFYEKGACHLPTAAFKRVAERHLGFLKADAPRRLSSPSFNSRSIPSKHHILNPLPLFLILNFLQFGLEIVPWNVKLELPSETREMRFDVLSSDVVHAIHA